MSQITATTAQLALSSILEDGGLYYLALFTVMPDADGTGGTEFTIGVNGYRRDLIDTWGTISSGDDYYRVNSLEWGTSYTITGNITGIVGWGIYDAQSSGNLLSFGTFQNSGGADITLNLVAGDAIYFAAQTLKALKITVG